MVEVPSVGRGVLTGTGGADWAARGDVADAAPSRRTSD